jgi:hypothetical protein
MFFIDENSLQFDNAQSGMRVIELDSNVFRELWPRITSLLEATNNVLESGRDKEELLLETQDLAALVVVVWIQTRSDVFGAVLLRDRLFIVSVVETSEIKLVCGLGAPQTDVDGVLGAESRNRIIVRDSNDPFRWLS